MWLFVTRKNNLFNDNEGEVVCGQRVRQAQETRGLVTFSNVIHRLRVLAKRVLTTLESEPGRAQFRYPCDEAKLFPLDLTQISGMNRLLS